MAANALSGRPVQTYLSLLKTDEGTVPHTAQQALNNLDTWERIERIRATGDYRIQIPLFSYFRFYIIGC